MKSPFEIILFFFFNDTATTEIYTLSLHDALPICPGNGYCGAGRARARSAAARRGPGTASGRAGDRKSTRLNSSHGYISYAVFCLKKKNDDMIWFADQNMPGGSRFTGGGLCFANTS